MTTDQPIARPTSLVLVRLLALAAGVLVLVGTVPAASVGAVDRDSPVVASSVQPTVQYEESVAHAGDRIAFEAGERVSVPFRPRSSDRWAVDGARPRALPAGRVSGRALRHAGPDPVDNPATLTVSHEPGGPTGWIDRPHDGPGEGSAVQADLAAAVDPGGLKREVFGFLPYWELTDSSTRLDWEKLSTVAYFGVGAAGNGDLQQKNSDGSTTVGWSGWTSSKMTMSSTRRTASGARVVLTVQSFAWSSAGVIAPEGAAGQRRHPRQPRPPDRRRRSRSRRRRRKPRLRADHLHL